ncbi:MAG: hypothetical protein LBQ12_12325 [Deltaproteobacteria bacterium]|nr:hypothetical protein [Deltaproteobacteria bacterium]
MEIIRSPFTRRQLECLNSYGYETYATVSGASAALLEKCVFDGATVFDSKGMQGANSFLTGKTTDSRGSPLAMFAAFRSFAVNDVHFLFSCFCCFQPGEAERGGYTSRDNPILLKYGTPAFDSIAFRP